MLTLYKRTQFLKADTNVRLYFDPDQYADLALYIYCPVLALRLKLHHAGMIRFKKI